MMFGTAGPPDSGAVKSTERGVVQSREHGLDCMEVLFVQGVKMGEATAAAVRTAARGNNVRLSCHAPYFINLASRDREKLEASMQRLFDAARVGSLCGADNVVFHPGFYTDMTPEETYGLIRKNLDKVVRRMKSSGIDGVTLRPEITGKPGQFGSLEEILRLCRDVDGTLPCIDFSHLYSRSIGKCNSMECFSGTLDEIGSALGGSALGDMHIHLSGMQYGPKGELRHLPMKESGLRYTCVLKALVNAGASGRVICESPEEAKLSDTLMFRRYYRRMNTIKKKKSRRRARTG